MKRSGLCICFCLFCLTGCAKVNQVAIDLAKKESGILVDQEYLQYENLKKNHKLNDKGEYSDSDIENKKEVVKDGSVYVTIADNPNLSFVFYKDKEHTKIVESNAYYNPGDCIYYDRPIVSNKNSDKYVFSGFRIYDVSDSGEKINEISCNSDLKEGYIQIPGNYTGSDLMLVPIGDYEERLLKFKDYYIDENGNENDISGTWIVNDGTVNVDGNTATIDSILDYSVTYMYDNNDYYVVATNPKNINDALDDGCVQFENQSATNGVDKFEVELHRYIDVKITVKGTKSVIVNGERKKVKKNKPIEVKHLKVGDMITVVSEEKCTFESDNVKVDTSEEVSEGYKYTLTVKDVSR